MHIGLIDVDGHNFPNIALMKLSAYHKAKGDSVEWYAVAFLLEEHYGIDVGQKIKDRLYKMDVEYIATDNNKCIQLSIGY